MPLKIQRVPRGLSQLLSIFGGQSPVELEDRTRGVIEMLQMYGTTQLQSTFTTNAAVAEGGSVQIVLSQTNWTVLFAAWAGISKTATMTALRGAITLLRNTDQGPLLFVAELGPFGATETGTVEWGGYLPYPLLCPPNTQVYGSPRILGTDATCGITVYAEYGVLG